MNNYKKIKVLIKGFIKSILRFIGVGTMVCLLWNFRLADLFVLKEMNILDGTALVWFIWLLFDVNRYKKINND